MVKNVPYGRDLKRYIEAVTAFTDAGFERIVVVPVGDDVEGFFSFWDEHVRPALA